MPINVCEVGTLAVPTDLKYVFEDESSHVATSYSNIGSVDLGDIVDIKLTVTIDVASITMCDEFYECETKAIALRVELVFRSRESISNYFRVPADREIRCGKSGNTSVIIVAETFETGVIGSIFKEAV